MPFRFLRIRGGINISKGNNSAKNVGGVNVFNLCMSSGHALYLCQVSWNYLERYYSYRADTISIRKNTNGNNSAKNVNGVTVVYLCTSSGHALNFYQVLWFYLKRYQSYRADTISILTRKSVHRTRMPLPNAIQKKGLYVTVTGIPWSYY